MQIQRCKRKFYEDKVRSGKQNEEHRIYALKKSRADLTVTNSCVIKVELVTKDVIVLAHERRMSIVIMR